MKGLIILSPYLGKFYFRDFPNPEWGCPEWGQLDVNDIPNAATAGRRDARSLVLDPPFNGTSFRGEGNRLIAWCPCEMRHLSDLLLVDHDSIGVYCQLPVCGREKSVVMRVVVELSS